MQPDLHLYIQAAWYTVAIVWLIGAFTTKRTVRSHPARSGFVYIVLILLAFLLFQKPLRFGLLAWRFVPMSAATGYVGLALTMTGCAFAIWARFYLGSNWSGRPTIKQDHTLIRSGPYRLVRHPIYTSIVVAMLGTAIYIGEIRALIGTVLALIALKLKSRLEEAFMTERFGAEYAQYKQQVKALIPFDCITMSAPSTVHFGCMTTIGSEGRSRT
jgi:protein-S-isoprenylcysteine O-methyltransferase Ste14